MKVTKAFGEADRLSTANAVEKAVSSEHLRWSVISEIYFVAKNLSDLYADDDDDFVLVRFTFHATRNQNFDSVCVVQSES